MKKKYALYIGHPARPGLYVDRARPRSKGRAKETVGCVFFVTYDPPPERISRWKGNERKRTRRKERGR